MKSLLIDTMPFEYTVEEGKNGVLYLKGPYSKADVPTANNRAYPSGILQREIKKLTAGMIKGRIFGELDHPGDGRTKLQRVSHLLRELKLGTDGLVIGKSKVIDTINGRQLRAIIEGGGQPGISSRGTGSVERRGTIDVVGDDYGMQTYDFVADPAFGEAYPSAVSEELLIVDFEDALLTVEVIKEKYPGLIEEFQEMLAEDDTYKGDLDMIAAMLRKEFSEKLTEAKTMIQVPGSDDSAAIQKELEEEKAKVVALETTVKAMQYDMSLFENVGTHLTMAHAAEVDLRDNPKRKEILSEAGPPTEFGSVDEYIAKVKEVSSKYETGDEKSPDDELNVTESKENGSNGKEVAESLDKGLDELKELHEQETLQMQEDFNEKEKALDEEITALKEKIELLAGESESELEEATNGFREQIKKLKEEKKQLELQLGIESLLRNRKDADVVRERMKLVKTIDEAVEVLKLTQEKTEPTPPPIHQEEKQDRSAKQGAGLQVTSEEAPHGPSLGGNVFGVSMREIVLRSTIK